MTEPLLLALDTATRTTEVALVDRTGRSHACRSRAVTTHSEMLLPTIDELLAETKRTLGELAAIACGAGPGSFTGLRIGLATAKGLCFATDRPLLLISSLAALAHQAGTHEAAILACLDARKGEIFVGAYRDGRALEPEQAIAPGALADFAARLGTPIQLIGDAALRYPELRAVGLWIDAVPSAAAIGALGWQRLARGEQDDLVSSAPSYVRGPEITVPKPRSIRPSERSK